MNKLEKESLELNNELKCSIIRKRNCEANLLIQKYNQHQKQFKEPEKIFIKIDGFPIHLPDGEYTLEDGTVLIYKNPSKVEFYDKQPKSNYLFFATLFTLISVLEAICLIYALF